MRKLLNLFTLRESCFRLLGNFPLLRVIPFVLAASASAQNAYLSNPHPCSAVNDARHEMATRTFPTFQPVSGPVKIVDPLNPGASSLKLVVLGDSVMWGDGLTNPEKFVTLAGQSIADLAQKNVEIITFAHSGARLTLCDKDNLVPLLNSDMAPPGDLDSERPSIAQQTDIAVDVSGDGDADLVLMDGCINEVGATKIAYPYFFDFVDKDEIAIRVHSFCSDNMAKALQHVQDRFRHATILMMGYYRVVSDKSSPWNVAARPEAAPPQGSNAMRKQFADAAAASLASRRKEMNRLFRTADKVERKEHLTGRFGQGSNSNAASTSKEAVFNARWQDWWENSTMFLERTNGCFAWAVAKANGETVKPVSEIPDSPCPPVTGSSSRNNRVYLVSPADSADYSYGAPQKHVWSVPVKIFGWIIRSDDMYRERVKLCNSHYSDGGSRFSCSVNATAHPNVPGAEAYRDAIAKMLETVWSPSAERASH
ncbi:MAG TPA: hypothetical protein VGR47_06195 [Terracidiphilus sp.]|nr:hypothetical protein [Terracidiphilus sp.]